MDVTLISQFYEPKINKFKRKNNLVLCKTLEPPNLSEEANP